MSTRRRLVALGVALVVLVAAAVVLLLRSRTPDCGALPPRASLAPALRALGDFDQAYNAADLAALQDAAERAASAQYPNLIGTTPEAPVVIHAAHPGGPDALVIPLRAQRSAAQVTPGVAGLAVFFRDCQGNAYFDRVEDDAASAPLPATFPAVGRDQAAAQLQTAAISLTYTTSPLQPRWTTVASPQRSVAAR